MHRHNGANQWNYIISGKIREENGPVQYAAGIMGYVPKGDTHGGSIRVEECLVLFHWDGPRDPDVVK